MSVLTGLVGSSGVAGGMDAAQPPSPPLPYLSIVKQSDIDRLNLAMASPERQVTLGNQTITYRSIADMILARDTLQAMLNAQNANLLGVSPRPRRIYAYYAGRGYSRDYE